MTLKGQWSEKEDFGVFLGSGRDPIMVWSGLVVVEMMRDGQLQNNSEVSQQDFLVCEDIKEKKKKSNLVLP